MRKDVKLNLTLPSPVLAIPSVTLTLPYPNSNPIPLTILLTWQASNTLKNPSANPNPTLP